MTMPDNEESYSADAYEYIDLYTVIDMVGFDYDDYHDGELNILEPRLKEIGYTDIQWGPGETDSFGPLTRTCQAMKDGKLYFFVYG
ncbi:MAG: hypothetical protein ABWY25_03625 [Paenisporosarcina sp.]